MTWSNIHIEDPCVLNVTKKFQLLLRLAPVIIARLL